MAQVVRPPDVGGSDDPLRRQQAVSDAVSRAALCFGSWTTTATPHPWVCCGPSWECRGRIALFTGVAETVGGTASHCTSLHHAGRAGDLWGHEQCMDAQLLLRRAQEDLLDTSGADELVPPSSRRCDGCIDFFILNRRTEPSPESSAAERQATQPLGLAASAWDWSSCPGGRFDAGAQGCTQECDLSAGPHPRNLVRG